MEDSQALHFRDESYKGLHRSPPRACGFWLGGLGEGFAAILESSSFQEMVVAIFIDLPAGGSTSTRMWKPDRRKLKISFRPVGLLTPNSP